MTDLRTPTSFTSTTASLTASEVSELHRLSLLYRANSPLNDLLDTPFDTYSLSTSSPVSNVHAREALKKALPQSGVFQHLSGSISPKDIQDLWNVFVDHGPSTLSAKELELVHTIAQLFSTPEVSQHLRLSSDALKGLRDIKTCIAACDSTLSDDHYLQLQESKKARASLMEITGMTPQEVEFRRRSQLVEPNNRDIQALKTRLFKERILNKSMSATEIAEKVLSYVQDNFNYKQDGVDSRGLVKDEWQTVDRTLSQKSGDCEDLAILTASLLSSALQEKGFSSKRISQMVMVSAGYVTPDNSLPVGHALVTFKASPESEALLLDATGETGGILASQLAFKSIVDMNHEVFIQRGPITEAFRTATQLATPLTARSAFTGLGAGRADKEFFLVDKRAYGVARSADSTLLQAYQANKDTLIFKINEMAQAINAKMLQDFTVPRSFNGALYREIKLPFTLSGGSGGNSYTASLDLNTFKASFRNNPQFAVMNQSPNDPEGLLSATTMAFLDNTDFTGKAQSIFEKQAELAAKRELLSSTPLYTEDRQPNPRFTALQTEINTLSTQIKRLQKEQPTYYVKITEADFPRFTVTKPDGTKVITANPSPGSGTSASATDPKPYPFFDVNIHPRFELRDQSSEAAQAIGNVLSFSANDSIAGLTDIHSVSINPEGFYDFIAKLRLQTQDLTVFATAILAVYDEVGKASEAFKLESVSDAEKRALKESGDKSTLKIGMDALQGIVDSIAQGLNELSDQMFTYISETNDVTFQTKLFNIDQWLQEFDMSNAAEAGNADSNASAVTTYILSTLRGAAPSIFDELTGSISYIRAQAKHYINQLQLQVTAENTLARNEYFKRITTGRLFPDPSTGEPYRVGGISLLRKDPTTEFVNTGLLSRIQGPRTSTIGGSSDDTSPPSSSSSTSRTMYDIFYSTKEINAAQGIHFSKDHIEEYMASTKTAINSLMTKANESFDPSSRGSVYKIGQSLGRFSIDLNHLENTETSPLFHGADASQTATFSRPPDVNIKEALTAALGLAAARTAIQVGSSFASTTLLGVAGAITTVKTGFEIYSQIERYGTLDSTHAPVFVDLNMEREVEFRQNLVSFQLFAHTTQLVLVAQLEAILQATAEFNASQPNNYVTQLLNRTKAFMGNELQAQKQAFEETHHSINMLTDSVNALITSRASYYKAYWTQLIRSTGLAIQSALKITATAVTTNYLGAPLYAALKKWHIDQDITLPADRVAAATAPDATSKAAAEAKLATDTGLHLANVLGFNAQLDAGKVWFYDPDRPPAGIFNVPLSNFNFMMDLLTFTPGHYITAIQKKLEYHLEKGIIEYRNPGILQQSKDPYGAAARSAYREDGFTFEPGHGSRYSYSNIEKYEDFLSSQQPVTDPNHLYGSFSLDIPRGFSDTLLPRDDSPAPTASSTAIGFVDALSNDLMLLRLKQRKEFSGDKTQTFHNGYASYQVKGVPGEPNSSNPNAPSGYGLSFIEERGDGLLTYNGLLAAVKHQNTVTLQLAIEFRLLILRAILDALDSAIALFAERSKRGYAGYQQAGSFDAIGVVVGLENDLGNDLSREIQGALFSSWNQNLEKDRTIFELDFEAEKANAKASGSLIRYRPRLLVKNTGPEAAIYPEKELGKDPGLEAFDAFDLAIEMADYYRKLARGPYLGYLASYHRDGNVGDREANINTVANRGDSLVGGAGYTDQPIRDGQTDLFNKPAGSALNTKIAEGGAYTADLRQFLPNRADLDDPSKDTRILRTSRTSDEKNAHILSETTHKNRLLAPFFHQTELEKDALLTLIKKGDVPLEKRFTTMKFQQVDFNTVTEVQQKLTTVSANRSIYLMVLQSYWDALNQEVARFSGMQSSIGAINTAASMADIYNSKQTAIMDSLVEELNNRVASKNAYEKYVLDAWVTGVGFMVASILLGAAKLLDRVAKPSMTRAALRKLVKIPSVMATTRAISEFLIGIIQISSINTKPPLNEDSLKAITNATIGNSDEKAQEAEALRAEKRDLENKANAGGLTQSEKERLNSINFSLAAFGSSTASQVTSGKLRTQINQNSQNTGTQNQFYGLNEKKAIRFSGRGRFILNPALKAKANMKLKRQFRQMKVLTKVFLALQSAELNAIADLSGRSAGSTGRLSSIVGAYEQNDARVLDLIFRKLQNTVDARNEALDRVKKGAVTATTALLKQATETLLKRFKGGRIEALEKDRAKTVLKQKESTQSDEKKIKELKEKKAKETDTAKQTEIQKKIDSKEKALTKKRQNHADALAKQDKKIQGLKDKKALGAQKKALESAIAINERGSAATGLGATYDSTQHRDLKRTVGSNNSARTQLARGFLKMLGHASPYIALRLFDAAAQGIAHLAQLTGLSDNFDINSTDLERMGETDTLDPYAGAAEDSVFPSSDFTNGIDFAGISGLENAILSAGITKGNLQVLNLYLQEDKEDIAAVADGLRSLKAAFYAKMKKSLMEGHLFTLHLPTGLINRLFNMHLRDSISVNTPWQGHYKTIEPLAMESTDTANAFLKKLEKDPKLKEAYLIGDEKRFFSKRPTAAVLNVLPTSAQARIQRAFGFVGVDFASEPDAPTRYASARLEALAKDHADFKKRVSAATEAYTKAAEAAASDPSNTALQAKSAAAAKALEKASEVSFQDASTALEKAKEDSTAELKILKAARDSVKNKIFPNFISRFLSMFSRSAKSQFANTKFPLSVSDIDKFLQGNTTPLTNADRKVIQKALSRAYSKEKLLLDTDSLRSTFKQLKQEGKRNEKLNRAEITEKKDTLDTVVANHSEKALSKLSEDEKLEKFKGTLESLGSDAKPTTVAEARAEFDKVIQAKRDALPKEAEVAKSKLKTFGLAIGDGALTAGIIAIELLALLLIKIFQFFHMIGFRNDVSDSLSFLNRDIRDHGKIRKLRGYSLGEALDTLGDAKDPKLSKKKATTFEEIRAEHRLEADKSRKLTEASLEQALNPDLDVVADRDSTRLEQQDKAILALDKATDLDGVRLTRRQQVALGVMQRNHIKALNAIKAMRGPESLGPRSPKLADDDTLQKMQTMLQESADAGETTFNDSATSEARHVAILDALKKAYEANPDPTQKAHLDKIRDILFESSALKARAILTSSLDRATLIQKSASNPTDASTSLTTKLYASKTLSADEEAQLKLLFPEDAMFNSKKTEMLQMREAAANRDLVQGLSGTRLLDGSPEGVAAAQGKLTSQNLTTLSQFDSGYALLQHAESGAGVQLNSLLTQAYLAEDGSPEQTAAIQKTAAYLQAFADPQNQVQARVLRHLFYELSRDRNKHLLSMLTKAIGKIDSGKDDSETRNFVLKALEESTAENGTQSFISPTSKSVDLRGKSWLGAAGTAGWTMLKRTFAGSSKFSFSLFGLNKGAKGSVIREADHNANDALIARQNFSDRIHQSDIFSDKTFVQSFLEADSDGANLIANFNDSTKPQALVKKLADSGNGLLDALIADLSKPGANAKLLAHLVDFKAHLKGQEASRATAVLAVKELKDKTDILSKAAKLTEPALRVLIDPETAAPEDPNLTDLKAVRDQFLDAIKDKLSTDPAAAAQELAEFLKKLDGPINRDVVRKFALEIANKVLLLDQDKLETFLTTLGTNLQSHQELATFFKTELVNGVQGAAAGAALMGPLGIRPVDRIWGSFASNHKVAGFTDALVAIARTNPAKAVDLLTSLSQEVVTHVGTGAEPQSTINVIKNMEKAVMAVMAGIDKSNATALAAAQTQVTRLQTTLQTHLNALISQRVLSDSDATISVALGMRAVPASLSKAQIETIQKQTQKLMDFQDRSGDLLSSEVPNPEYYAQLQGVSTLCQLFLEADTHLTVTLSAPGAVPVPAGPAPLPAALSELNAAQHTALQSGDISTLGTALGTPPSQAGLTAIKDNFPQAYLKLLQSLDDSPYGDAVPADLQLVKDNDAFFKPDGTFGDLNALLGTPHPERSLVLMAQVNPSAAKALLTVSPADRTRILTEINPANLTHDKGTLNRLLAPLKDAEADTLMPGFRRMLDQTKRLTASIQPGADYTLQFNAAAYAGIRAEVAAHKEALKTQTPPTVDNFLKLQPTCSPESLGALLKLMATVTAPTPQLRALFSDITQELAKATLRAVASFPALATGGLPDLADPALTGIINTALPGVLDGVPGITNTHLGRLSAVLPDAKLQAHSAVRDLSGMTAGQLVRELTSFSNPSIGVVKLASTLSEMSQKGLLKDDHLSDLSVSINSLSLADRALFRALLPSTLTLNPTTYPPLSKDTPEPTGTLVNLHKALTSGDTSAILTAVTALKTDTSFGSDAARFSALGAFASGPQSKALTEALSSPAGLSLAGWMRSSPDAATLPSILKATVPLVDTTSTPTVSKQEIQTAIASNPSSLMDILSRSPGSSDAVFDQLLAVTTRHEFGSKLPEPLAKLLFSKDATFLTTLYETLKLSHPSKLHQFSRLMASLTRSVMRPEHPNFPHTTLKADIQNTIPFLQALQGPLNPTIGKEQLAGITRQMEQFLASHPIESREILKTMGKTAGSDKKQIKFVTNLLFKTLVSHEAISSGKSIATSIEKDYKFIMSLPKDSPLRQAMLDKFTDTRGLFYSYLSPVQHRIDADRVTESRDAAKDLLSKSDPLSPTETESLLKSLILEGNTQSKDGPVNIRALELAPGAPWKDRYQNLRIHLENLAKFAMQDPTTPENQETLQLLGQFAAAMSKYQPISGPRLNPDFLLKLMTSHANVSASSHDATQAGAVGSSEQDLSKVTGQVSRYGSVDNLDPAIGTANLRALKVISPDRQILGAKPILDDRGFVMRPINQGLSKQSLAAALDDIDFPTSADKQATVDQLFVQLSSAADGTAILDGSDPAATSRSFNPQLFESGFDARAIMSFAKLDSLDVIKELRADHDELTGAGERAERANAIQARLSALILKHAWQDFQDLQTIQGSLSPNPAISAGSSPSLSPELKTAVDTLNAAFNKEQEGYRTLSQLETNYELPAGTLLARLKEQGFATGGVISMPRDRMVDLSDFPHLNLKEDALRTIHDTICAVQSPREMVLSAFSSGYGEDLLFLPNERTVDVTRSVHTHADIRGSKKWSGSQYADSYLSTRLHVDDQVHVLNRYANFNDPSLKPEKQKFKREGFERFLLSAKETIGADGRPLLLSMLLHPQLSADARRDILNFVGSGAVFNTPSTDPSIRPFTTLRTNVQRLLVGLTNPVHHSETRTQAQLLADIALKFPHEFRQFHAAAVDTTRPTYPVEWGSAHKSSAQALFDQLHLSAKVSDSSAKILFDSLLPATTPQASYDALKAICLGGSAAPVSDDDASSVYSDSSSISDVSSIATKPPLVNSSPSSLMTVLISLKEMSSQSAVPKDALKKLGVTLLQHARSQGVTLTTLLQGLTGSDQEAHFLPTAVRLLTESVDAATLKSLGYNPLQEEQGLYRYTVSGQAPARAGGIKGDSGAFIDTFDRPRYRLAEDAPAHTLLKGFSSSSVADQKATLPQILFALKAPTGGDTSPVGGTDDASTVDGDDTSTVGSGDGSTVGGVPLFADLGADDASTVDGNDALDNWDDPDFTFDDRDAPRGSEFDYEGGYE